MHNEGQAGLAGVSLPSSGADERVSSTFLRRSWAAFLMSCMILRTRVPAALLPPEALLMSSSAPWTSALSFSYSCIIRFLPLTPKSPFAGRQQPRSMWDRHLAGPLKTGGTPAPQPADAEVYSANCNVQSARQTQSGRTVLSPAGVEPASPG